MFRRHPNVSTRSAFSTAKLPPRVPTVLGLPTNNGCASHKTSWAFHAVTTGIFNFSITSINSLCASPRRIPVPAKISGRFAALIFSKISTAVAASTFGGISSAHSDLSKCFRSSVSTMAAWISNGTSNHTGPPLPALLKYNAFSK